MADPGGFQSGLVGAPVWFLDGDQFVLRWDGFEVAIAEGC